jgi:hypothetical protein
MGLAIKDKWTTFRLLVKAYTITKAMLAKLWLSWTKKKRLRFQERTSLTEAHQQEWSDRLRIFTIVQAQMNNGLSLVQFLALILKQIFVRVTGVMSTEIWLELTHGLHL